jgi:Protein of unknown function with HXXEE motif
MAFVITGVAMSRVENGFGALVLVQAAHSAEEYMGMLWISFPPTRYVVGLVSSNPERGFVLLNICIIALGLWCYLWPVRRHWTVAKYVIWCWVVVETINGIVHPLWSIWQRGYTPGLFTAVILLILAVYLATQVERT